MRTVPIATELGSSATAATDKFEQRVGMHQEVLMMMS